MATTPTDGTGHRERLRQRLLEGGHEALHDHELVEYLLALVTPRRDTKTKAKQLLAAFGGYGGLLAATPDELANADLRETEIAALMIAKASALRLLQSEVRKNPVLSDGQALLDYLHADMAHLPTERVRVLYLNTRNMLIRDEVPSEGTIDQATIHVREIIRRAIETKAASLILVHNHPSGDSTPSQADIHLTREVIEAGKPLGIAVHDHLIVGAQGHSSLRAMGVI